MHSQGFPLLSTLLSYKSKTKSHKDKSETSIYSEVKHAAAESLQKDKHELETAASIANPIAPLDGKIHVLSARSYVSVIEPLRDLWHLSCRYNV